MESFIAIKSGHASSRCATLLRAMRPPFLLLTPVCLGLSWSLLPAAHGEVLGSLILALLGAILAHIAVNMLNEYQDYRSGLDLHTRRTAFSGGSGALPASPGNAGAVLAGALLALFGSAAIGLYFVYHQGWRVLLIGVLGVALILLYSGWINRRPWLCLIAPGFGFGLLMVPGSQLVMGGELSIRLWAAALLGFFLVNNLLLLNQYPDIAADQRVGRRHIAIRFGIPVANGIFGVFTFAALTSILVPVSLGWYPPQAVIAVLPLGLSGYAFSGARRHGAALGDHPRYLAANVVATLSTPALLAVSLLLA